MRSQSVRFGAVFGDDDESVALMQLVAAMNDLRSIYRFWRSSGLDEQEGRTSKAAARGDRLHMIRMTVLHLHEIEDVLHSNGLRLLVGRFETREPEFRRDLDAMLAFFKKGGIAGLLRAFRDQTAGHYLEKETRKALKAMLKDEPFIELPPARGKVGEHHLDVSDHLWATLIEEGLKGQFPTWDFQTAFEWFLRKALELNRILIRFTHNLLLARAADGPLRYRAR